MAGVFHVDHALETRPGREGHPEVVEGELPANVIPAFGRGRDPNRPPSYSDEDDQEKAQQYIQHRIPRDSGIKIVNSYAHLRPQPPKGSHVRELVHWRQNFRIPLSKFDPDIHIPLATGRPPRPFAEVERAPSRGRIIAPPSPPPARASSRAPKRRAAASSEPIIEEGDGRWVPVQTTAWRWEASDWSESRTLADPFLLVGE